MVEPQLTATKSLAFGSAIGNPCSSQVSKFHPTTRRHRFTSNSSPNQQKTKYNVALPPYPPHCTSCLQRHLPSPRGASPRRGRNHRANPLQSSTLRPILATPLHRTLAPLLPLRRITSDAKRTIDGVLSTAPVVLFMKGTPETPQCGFSKASVQILGLQGVDPVKFAAFNVLEDDEVRQGTLLGFLSPRKTAVALRLRAS